MTTLVWPSEAISKTVLDTLTGPGGAFELREEDVLGARMLVFANRPRSIIELLQERGIEFTDVEGWIRLDAHERSLGNLQGRERIKVVPRDEMIQVSRGE